MRIISAFDVIGPIMIGPSSSHTAGAVKIGRVARKFAKKDIRQAWIYLHGSFAKTHKGHGTDKALLGGLLGMDPFDERIKHSFEIADSEGILFSFIEVDLGDVHPNTVRIVIENAKGEKISLQGSSLGGGAIKISKLNDIDFNFTGDLPTIIVTYHDTKGMISKISSLLAQKGLNIAFMSVFRESKGKTAYAVIELDDRFDIGIREDIKEAMDDIMDVFMLQ
jgi:L-serine dehydratase